MIATPHTPSVRRPVRTCLGCRKRDGQGALVRLAADGTRVAVDLDRRRPGRGAWVHRDPKCVARLPLGAVERTLRTKLAADALHGVGAAIGSVAGQTDSNQVKLPPASPADPHAGAVPRAGHGTPER